MTFLLGLIPLVAVAIWLAARWWLRRKLRRQKWQAAMAQEAKYPAAGDIPEAFLDKRAGITEARRVALIEDLQTLGMKYDPELTYNAPAVHAAALHKAADQQVQRLERARAMLLSAMDGFERRFAWWRDQAPLLAAESEKQRERLWGLCEAEAQRRAEAADRLDADASDPGVVIRGVAAFLRQPVSGPNSLDDVVRVLVELAAQGPDPDGDYARVRALASNIQGPGWRSCGHCGHYLLDHQQSGACLVPCAASGEVASHAAEGEGRCRCTSTPGLADVIVPTPLPKRTPASTRGRRGRG